VGSQVVRLAKKEFGSLQDKVTTTPVLIKREIVRTNECYKHRIETTSDESSLAHPEPHALLGQPSLKIGIVRVVDNVRCRVQRAIMRGTLALDEEDCAHLDAVQREKNKREQAIKAQMDEELALFRAAREDRSQEDLVVDDDDDGEKVQKEDDLNVGAGSLLVAKSHQRR
jgi:hypothetical protein